MIRNVARNTAISTVTFFVVILIWRGEGFGHVQLLTAAITAVMFAMFYAAIQVAMIMFRRRHDD